MLLTRVNSGLDGIVVADTVMSEVDGEAGRLTVRGHEVEELAATRGFEGVAALLWDGYAEGGGDEAAVRDAFAAARVKAFGDVPRLLAATRGLNPVEALRVGIGMLPDSESMPHHFRLCGALPVFLAALLNAEKDLAPVSILVRAPLARPPTHWGSASRPAATDRWATHALKTETCAGTGVGDRCGVGGFEQL